MCAELLFGSVLVHIISFECPLKKNIYSKKKKEKKEKEKKQKKKKRGALCLRLCPGSRL